MLFFKSKSNNEEKKQVNSINTELADDVVDKKKFLFVNYVSGIKGIPYDTTSLLVNDIEGASLNFVYKLETEQIIKIPITAVNSISYMDRVGISNEAKKVEDNDTKSMLLSTVIFGGSPLQMMVGKEGINKLLGSISDNYDKVDFNTYYEITIDVTLNNESKKLLFTCDVLPKEFIDMVLSQINK